MINDIEQLTKKYRRFKYLDELPFISLKRRNR